MTTLPPEPPQPLPNPERHWARRRELVSVDVAEIEACLGHRVSEPLDVLSGGLANVNVRVGARVVRIHRRDPSITALEARLLSRSWKSFRVPRVLSVGDAFLVLEHVEHGPVLATAEHGAAVGRALAEIHSARFDSAGHFDPTSAELRVGEPFPDLVDALFGYTRTCLASESSGVEPELASRVLRALREAAPMLRERAGPPVLLHADFKPSNLHWATDDRLLVLDWEFAYAGAALSDIGQLLRWEPAEPFVDAFAASYASQGGVLAEDWRTWAAAYDLVNLAGLLANLAEPTGDSTSARIRDVRARISKTLDLVQGPPSAGR